MTEQCRLLPGQGGAASPWDRTQLCSQTPPCPPPPHTTAPAAELVFCRAGWRDLAPAQSRPLPHAHTCPLPDKANLPYSRTLLRCVPPAEILLSGFLVWGLLCSSLPSDFP